MLVVIIETEIYVGVFLASLPSLPIRFQPRSRPFVDGSHVLEYAKIQTLLQFSSLHHLHPVSY